MELPDKSEVLEALNNHEIMDNVLQKSMSDPAIVASLQREMAEYISRQLVQDEKMATILIEKAINRGLIDVKLKK